MQNNGSSVSAVLFGKKTEKCLSCVSWPGSIFCNLSPASLGELEQSKTTRIYQAGASVFREADQPQAVYCVGSGFLKLSRSSPGGRAVVFGIAKGGDVLGVRPLLLGKPHDLTAEATEETRLCLIPRNDFLDFLGRNGDVSLRLAQKLSLELGEAYQQVYGVALKSAVERLADVLLALCQSHGQPVPEGIGLMTNMGQNELAEMAGMSRRNLNRALGTLRGQGLIECRRRSIVVRNIVALRNRRVF